MAKKKGGTLFGNLLATVANKSTGGLLGSKRVALLKSNPELINADSPPSKALKAAYDEAGITTIPQPISTTMSVQSAQNLMSNSNTQKPALDLNNFIKLPDVNMNPTQLIMMGLAFFGILYAITSNKNK